MTGTTTINGEANLLFNGTRLIVNGGIYQYSVAQNVTATGTVTIDVQAANVHILNVSNGVTISSISYTNRSTDPSVNTLYIVIKQNGTASINWTSVLWANGVIPSLTNTTGYADVFMLTSYKGASGSWIGSVVGLAYVNTTL